MIMFYMMPRRMVLKKHEIQEFRGIAEGLVGESGIDVDFPSETPPARGMKVVGWILALVYARLAWNSSACHLFTWI